MWRSGRPVAERSLTIVLDGLVLLGQSCYRHDSRTSSCPSLGRLGFLYRPTVPHPHPLRLALQAPVAGPETRHEGNCGAGSIVSSFCYVFHHAAPRARLRPAGQPACWNAQECR